MAIVEKLRPEQFQRSLPDNLMSDSASIAQVLSSSTGVPNEFTRQIWCSACSDRLNGIQLREDVKFTASDSSFMPSSFVNFSACCSDVCTYVCLRFISSIGQVMVQMCCSVLLYTLFRHVHTAAFSDHCRRLESFAVFGESGIPSTSAVQS